VFLLEKMAKPEDTPRGAPAATSKLSIDETIAAHMEEEGK
jgi:hypothetical protein